MKYRKHAAKLGINYIYKDAMIQHDMQYYLIYHFSIKEGSVYDIKSLNKTTN